MPPVHHKVARKQLKQEAAIPGTKALHRGIHHHEHSKDVAAWMTNGKAKRMDPRELMVHHQKINDDMKDLYARTAMLSKDDMTMEERKEESWKAFERIGGKRPKAHVGYREHLEKISVTKKSDRVRVEDEQDHGDVDWAEGSAVDRAKKVRIKNFLDNKKRKDKMFKAHGDPNPMKQSGKFDRFTNMLTIPNRQVRKVDRSMAHDARVGQVKERKGGKSMWDSGSYDINARGSGDISDASKDWNLGPKSRKSSKRGRS
jgi:hypothetical protein